MNPQKMSEISDKIKSIELLKIRIYNFEIIISFIVMMIIISYKLLLILVWKIFFLFLFFFLLQFIIPYYLF